MFTTSYENGYSPIPLYFKGKNPCINEWQKFCKTRATESQIMSWEIQLKERRINIGIACGQASNIVVLDIDTDDKEFLNSLPPSPVRRRGKKGEARFFRYTPSVESKSLPNLDILSDGRQIVVPPSIHPEGMNYVWLTRDTIENTKPEELPALPDDFIESISKRLSKVKTELSGRNNKLKDIVCSMRGRGEDIDKITKEVYEYDLKFHNPPLFSDPKEMKATSKKDAQNNAHIFVMNIVTSLTKSGVINFDCENHAIILDEEQEKKFNDLYKSKEYPEPTGLIKDIRDLIIEYSERKMPNIALGGAVALMAAVCSNRFRFNQCWSNMYILNLAPTGSGKSFPQKVISKILNEKFGGKISGFGNYNSNAAFSKNLKSNRERLDVIDEISSLFAQMKSGGLWQASILEEMCKIWSSSSDLYAGNQYADDMKDTSTCFNPCVNILGSSTIEGIKPNITKLMVTKGLIPRFVIFKDDNYGGRGADNFNYDLFKEICLKISKILKNPKRERKDVEVDITIGPVYDPIDLKPVKADAVLLFDEIKDDFFKRIEIEPSILTKDMLTRGKEQIMKLATCHAAGNFRDSIECEDLVWARQTFEVSLHNSKDFIEETAVDTDWERDVQTILKVFKDNAGKVVTDKLISNRASRIQPQRREQVMKHLLVSEIIIKSEKTHPTNKTKISGHTLVIQS